MNHDKFETISEVQRFREIGGVLDFMYVDYISEHNLHAVRLAAYLFAYWTIERELQFRREVLLKTQQGGRVTYQFRGEPPQTVEQVTALEFAGDYYDWATGAPRVRKGAEVLGQGYAHAFANPPYRLRAHSDC